MIITLQIPDVCIGGAVVELKLGDLILERGTGPISEAIEQISHSPYSHVAGYVKDNELIEANGFRRIGYQVLDFYIGRVDVFRCSGLTDGLRSQIVDYAKNEIGGHYDYFLLGWEYLRYVFHLILPYKEPTATRICSTLWSDAYRSVGIDLCPGIKFPSPGDLAESRLLQKIGSI